ncbi:MAG TPA: type II toxin-antitoxin system RelE/ParE family toxin [Rickettsia endosymbiont of Pyrocoelia pectoralis]|nr:type II toxin-antitoxin system RelE/ParE family toxin [Rickettsia endosymbiont of Pyrocoelia pectoralis]
MVYKVYWKSSALVDLSKLCSSISTPLKEKIDSYLIKSPQALGKPLTGKYRKLYRYRYGDYRVIYELDKKNKLVSVLRIGHRSEIYN